MIRVVLQPEPASFDKKVRQPGLKALDRFNKGKIKKLPSIWRKCIDDLWQAYNGTCAYLCVYIFRAAGANTVEHFSAKSSDRNSAYEWKNYRLVCATLNGWKSAYDDVLDPCKVRDGWFELDFSSGEPLVVPGSGLNASRLAAVKKTIKRLRLNDSKCISDRKTYYDEYKAGETTYRHLERYCPFVAREVKRLGLRRPGDATVRN